MPPSYRRIDYRLRTAKHVERKMFVDMIRRLGSVASLESYRYVGMGSVAFADFSMFHKAFGWTSMRSMERDANNSQRFEFNRPFSFVEMAFEESSRALLRERWDHRTVLWLDYDDVFQGSMLADVKLFVRNAPALSVLLLSANVTPPEVEDGDDYEDEVELFRDRVGSSAALPFARRDLQGATYAKTCHQIVLNAIRDALDARNQGLSDDLQLAMEDLLFFVYRDGSPMLTYGGLMHLASDEVVDRCGFGTLPFVTGREKFEIDPPLLTMREMRDLEKLLPEFEGSHWLRDHQIPVAEARKYAGLYRYLPLYADVEL